MGYKCRVEGCDQADKEYPQPQGLALHIMNKHDVKGKEAYDLLREWGYMPDKKAKKSGAPKTSTKADAKDEYDIEDDDYENIDPLDPLSELIKILKHAGIPQWKSVVDNFRYGNPDDIAKLTSLITMTGCGPAKTELAVSAWKAYRSVPSAGHDSSGDRPVTEEHDTRNAMDDLKKTVNEARAKAIKELTENMEMAKIIDEAEALGIDVSRFRSLFPGMKRNTETKQESADDEKIEISWPPDDPAAKTIRVTPERHAELMRKWNLAMAAKNEKSEKEETKKSTETATWVDPVTSQMVQVPISEYPKFINMTNEYLKRRETESKRNPELERLENKLADIDKENRSLRDMLTQKEKEDLFGVINQQQNEQKKLKEELDKIKNQDPIESASGGWQKLTQKMKEIGWAPQGISTMDQIALQKSTVQGEVVSSSFKTIADKVSKSKFGTGDNLNTVLNSDLVKKLTNRLIGDNGIPGGQEAGYTQEQIDTLDKALNNDGTVQQETSAPAPKPKPDIHIAMDSGYTEKPQDDVGDDGKN